MSHRCTKSADFETARNHQHVGVAALRLPTRTAPPVYPALRLVEDMVGGRTLWAKRGPHWQAEKAISPFLFRFDHTHLSIFQFFIFRAFFAHKTPHIFEKEHPTLFGNVMDGYVYM